MEPAAKQAREQALRKAHDWRVLINGPDATDADRKAFEMWRTADPLHVDMYDYAVTFHQALGSLEAQDLDKDVLRPTLREYFAALYDGFFDLFALKRARIGVLGSVLASVALAIFLIVNPNREAPTSVKPPVIARYETAVGETRAITLADGTIMTLGAASAVETSYSDANRNAMVLAGVAFFDVAKAPSRPFLVKAGDLKAQVIGTEFNVSLSGEAVRVAVVEGEVKVSYPLILNDEPSSFLTSKNLTAGQQIAATSSEGLKDVKTVDVSAVGAWRENKLLYNGARLSELIADANRYSDVPLVISGDLKQVKDYRVRGAFNARDIDGMLETLVDIYPIMIDRSQSDLIRIVVR